MNRPHLITLIVSLAMMIAGVSVHAENASLSLLDKTDFKVSIPEGKYPAEKVADEVTRQTGVAFSYSKTLADTVIEVSDVTIESGTLPEILHAVFVKGGVA